VLTLSARAWLKLQYLCHAAETEVGGFGLSNSDDLLYIDDIVTVKQQCTPVSVEFDDASVADFFDEQIEQGRRPEQCGRIWVHTHPGDSAAPSCLDEETFDRVFGRCNWAVMFILACGGQTYCRLRLNSQSGNAARNDDGGAVSLSSVLPVVVDYGSLVEEIDHLEFESWAKELKDNVHIAKESTMFGVVGRNGTTDDLDLLDLDALDIDEAMLDGFDPSDESLWDELNELQEVDDEPE